MTFIENVKAIIRPELYAHIEAEAKKEVSLALQMPLKDKHGTDQYYSPRLFLIEFEDASDRLEKTGLPVLPIEILNVLFRCRLLKAAKDEKEFSQRLGRLSFFENRATIPHWSDKATALGDLDK